MRHGLRAAKHFESREALTYRAIGTKSAPGWEAEWWDGRGESRGD